MINTKQPGYEAALLIESAAFSFRYFPVNKVVTDFEAVLSIFDSAALIYT